MKLVWALAFRAVGLNLEAPRKVKRGGTFIRWGEFAFRKSRREFDMPILFHLYKTIKAMSSPLFSIRIPNSGGFCGAEDLDYF